MNIGIQSGMRPLINEAARWIAEERSPRALTELLARDGCYIYGAGGYGRQVAATLLARDIAVHGFVDGSAKAGATLDGIRKLRREDVPAGHAAAHPVIIAINNFQSPIDEVAAWAGATFADIVFVPELPEALDAALGVYWQGPRTILADHAAELDRLWHMLGDETSRQILTALVEYRMRGKPQFHPPVDRQCQYFPRDHLLPMRELSVVDCGAFPGDMVGAAAAAGHSLRHWFAFEPDPQNFAILAGVAREAKLPGASLFPCGVGDRTGMVGFAAGSADASRAVEGANDGVSMVPIVRVDDVLVADRIEMVKLDVEGFEAQALDGMAQTLATHRPRVCMAIYHKPADLWELPFKLAGDFPDARFAIRQHGYNGYDTVLYADL